MPDKDNEPNTNPPGGSCSGEKRVQGGSTSEDASRGEVAIYAFGNIESAIADNFPGVLQNILVVAAHVNPLLLGLVMGIKTLWDAVTDPIMAYLTDNTRSRFGRRRPYILCGGVLRVLFLVVFVAFLPTGSLTPNPVMEAQRIVKDAAKKAETQHHLALRVWREMSSVEPAGSDQLIAQIEGPSADFPTSFWPMSSAARESFDSLMQKTLEKIRSQLPILRKDLEDRQQALVTARDQEAALEAAAAPADRNHAATLATVRGQRELAESRLATAESLLVEADRAQSRAIAAQAVARHVLAKAGRLQDVHYVTEESTRSQTEELLRREKLPIIEIFSHEPVPVPVPAAPREPLRGIQEGIEAFFDPRNQDQRDLVVYLLVGLLIFTTLTTVTSVPYYALGIELSPSYDGRTRVVVYRSVISQVAGLVSPWVPVLCFSLIFANAFEGLFWVAVFSCLIGIPSTVLMFFKTRERTRAQIKKPGERPNLFLAILQIAKAPDFLRILFLYVFIGLVNGLFAQIGFFLNVYWVTGSALTGATLGAQVSLVAWVLGFLTLPVINWACRRFQKHRVLQFAVVWMAIGTALKWWLVNPAHPEYQFILPFFFSVGIASVYTVLPTMMADITDLDELKYGVRREGMFGAVMAFLMKGISTVVPIAAGAVLVISGFDPSLEYRQEPSTILNMRVMYSIVPAVMLLGALFALYKYPLTRERVQEVKEKLSARHVAGEASA
ncbi:MAG: hypothetical protein Fur0032_05780 [Terrimicrobiaceae bacterium]